MFRGVFASFADAERSAPTVKALGYDNSDSAKLYDDLTKRIAAYDYPVLHWMGRLFEGGATRVFDLGGHVGVAYYSYRRYLRYPENLEWKVYDLPAVVEEGRKRAKEQDSFGALKFTVDFRDASDTDVLFASGSLQYLPTRLGALLKTLSTLPSHIIVNQLPVHPHKSYFTLNSIGTAFCPYQIFAEGAFLDELTQAGYECRDRWENPGKRCEIPYPRGYSIDGYAGYYFQRRA
jgi:putative methyltransferase (TIGR04325 family)